jgi:uncharacterized membrane protein
MLNPKTMTPTMNLRKTLSHDWPILLVLTLPFVLIGIFWDQIPERIPTHWGIDGQPDGWGEKGFDVFILPLTALGAYLLLIFVPYIDPKRKTDNRQKALRAFRLIMPVLLTGIFFIVLLQWIGYAFNFSGMIYLGVTLLYLVFGNYMQSLKPNYFIGIRTPWTLESEEIWRKTHRLGGKVWVIGALVMLVMWFLFDQTAYFMIFMTGTIAIALIPTAYSFYLYVKERKSTGEETAS